ncbi:hypothetical protein B0H11DRAFT_2004455 [Mycena galericulata]|nr:hypothetical protein B0H11DRAFT_2004455 [Mycena galericulata]
MPKSRNKAKGPAGAQTDMKSEMETRQTSADIYKNLGNDFFRQGKYQEAAEMYNSAVEVFGTQPVYMSNLSATYLKLGDYEMAEKAASMALIHDPRMTKARYRRGLARKKSRKLKAAKTDFMTILRDDPSCVEAQVEFATVQRLCEIHGEHDDGSGSGDYEYPSPDCAPRPPLPVWLVSEDDSESSDSEGDGDSEHVGNGIPCKHHNLKPDGCAKGASCAYSHAPDARSIPDNQGRNVCLYFLLGSCKFGERCLYSHSKANLPELWGEETRIPDVRSLIRHNEEMIRERRLYTKYMGKGPLGSDTLLAVKHAVDKAKAKEARKQRKALTLLAMMDLLENDNPVQSTSQAPTAPFVVHLTLNKSTTIPGSTLSHVREVVDVSRVKSKTKAQSFLSSPALVGVFITDAGIILPKNTDLLAKLATYARNGGIVVIGGTFKTFEKNKQTDVSEQQVEAFFRKGWGLPWKMGLQRRTDLALNKNHSLAGSSPALPDSYSISGLHLKDVRADAALYLPPGHSQLNAEGFHATNLAETPVAFTQLGKGHLGFIGDANAEEATADVVLAMLGLSS